MDTKHTSCDWSTDRLVRERLIVGSRRLRGLVLRLAYHQKLALVSGVICLAGALWLATNDYSWEGSFSSGFEMIIGATGMALVFMALSGRQPDWEE